MTEDQIEGWFWIIVIALAPFVLGGVLGLLLLGWHEIFQAFRSPG